MKAVVQRVSYAKVDVGGETVGSIGPGLLVLLGIEPEDGERDIAYMVKKSTQLRIFEDEQGKMNLSALELGYSILLVSQFTLLGDARKGNRPAFIGAAAPEIAQPLFNEAAREFSRLIHTETGVFGADMKVTLVNDGPVTILLDSKKNY